MEKHWFPQRNTLDSPVALLKSFIHHIEYPVSKITIEQEVKAHKEYPYLTFQAIKEILEKWTLKSVVFDCDVTKLKDIPSPSILFIHDQHGEIKTGQFVMYYGTDGKTIEYLHSRRGWVYEPINEFEKKWPKVALSLTEAESPEGEKDFEEKEKAFSEKFNSNPDLKNVKIKDEFLTNEECDHIIKLAQSEFKRSGLMENEIKFDFGRTSYSSEFHVFPDDPILEEIRQKASRMINVPASHFEHFQCVSYESGQEYQNHFDTFDENHVLGKKAIEEGGQRKYTLLAYLNDDFEGGGTHFPNLDVLVQPKKGRVVIFNNLDENEKVIQAAYHAGLPVSKGRKYAINIWVRTKPCRK